MRTRKTKTVALYETRMSGKYIAKTIVCYIAAAVVWYIIAAIAPYIGNVNVSAEASAQLNKAAFCATSEQIGRDEAEKERALLLPSSSDTFYFRLKLIEDATRTLDCLIFTGYDDSYSRHYYTALLRAADRGVKVRIVQDGKQGRLSGGLADIYKLLCNHQNIEFYYFNAVRILKPSGINSIMHDKLTVIDGNRMMVGGVNIGLAAYLYNYDMEVLITNSGERGSVGQAENYFDKMLSFEYTERQHSAKAKSGVRDKCENEFNQFYNEYPHKQDKIEYCGLGTAVDKVTLLTNPVNDQKKQPIILRAVLNMMSESEKTTVVTPYMLLTNRYKKEIKSIARSGKQIDVITNSLYNSRNVGYADYFHTRSDYLSDNITLREYQAVNQLHAKMFTFDGRISVIGSFNLDERSSHIDTESVVIIDSEQFTAQLNSYINKTFIDNSLTVGADNTYLPSGTVTAGKVTHKKMFIYNILSVLSYVRYLI